MQTPEIRGTWGDHKELVAFVYFLCVLVGWGGGLSACLASIVIMTILCSRYGPPSGTYRLEEFAGICVVLFTRFRVVLGKSAKTCIFPKTLRKLQP